MKKTKIEWCDSTWNPVTGCRHGCEYCYARKIANRFCGFDCGPAAGCNVSDGGKSIFSMSEPMKRNGKAAPYPFGFEPTIHRYRLDEPKRWTKSRNIFVCSMADLFGDWVPDEWIADVFAACDAAPQHNYLFLTKNPKRYCEFGVPIADNMWYGTSMTDKTNGGNFNYLPAFGNTFLSMEPLLEDIGKSHNCAFHLVRWVIIGAETGNRKGKITPEPKWIQSITEECDRNGIPVFMKNSLVPIVGEENMRREFPWKKEDEPCD